MHLSSTFYSPPRRRVSAGPAAGGARNSLRWERLRSSSGAATGSNGAPCQGRRHKGIQRTNTGKGPVAVKCKNSRAPGPSRDLLTTLHHRPPGHQPPDEPAAPRQRRRRPTPVTPRPRRVSPGATFTQTSCDHLRPALSRGLFQSDRAHRLVRNFDCNIPARGFDLNQIAFGKRLFTGWPRFGTSSSRASKLWGDTGRTMPRGPVQRNIGWPSTKRFMPSGLPGSSIS